jgi:hypothetical protein
VAELKTKADRRSLFYDLLALEDDVPSTDYNIYDAREDALLKCIIGIVALIGLIRCDKLCYTSSDITKLCRRALLKCRRIYQAKIDTKVLTPLQTNKTSNNGHR